MHPAIRCAATLVIIPCFTACSLFGSHYQTISVSSEPPGAEVLVNGNRVGTTPLQTQVQRREELLVEVRKPGYETQFRSAERTLSTFGIVDIIGGWLILLPFLGLLSPAAWQQEPSNFGIDLTPESAATPPAQSHSAP